MNHQYKRSMPNDFVFVRHGESEANVVQRAEYAGEIHPQHDEIAYRADWKQRLTKKGVAQSQAAGEWIKQNLGTINSFNGKFVSPFLRARETAGYIGGDNWIIDDRIVERFRGVYGVVSYEKALGQAAMVNMRDVSSWYARIDGAESLQDVFGRYRIFQNSIRRHHGNQKVIVVAHSDFIKTACYAIEWMLPEDWQEDAVRLPNGGLVHYSRVNPHNPTDIRDSITWRRIVYPSDLAKSPNGGDWQEISIKRRYSSAELLDSVEVAETILD